MDFLSRVFIFTRNIWPSFFFKTTICHGEDSIIDLDIENFHVGHVDCVDSIERIDK